MADETDWNGWGGLPTRAAGNLPHPNGSPAAQRDEELLRTIAILDQRGGEDLVWDLLDYPQRSLIEEAVKAFGDWARDLGDDR